MSLRENKTKELGDSICKQLEHTLDQEIASKKGVNRDYSNCSREELFAFAAYDDRAAEGVGYSNYSYWRSTFQVFFKNKLAVVLLCVIIGIILFTFIQPFIPGQKDPNLIFNDPETGIQIRNQSPNKDFWFGSNQIGQDLWSRIWSLRK